jgi:hypothetical protein
MNVDTELDVWRQQWQSGPTIPLDLRRKVERQSRILKLNLIAEILVTIMIGGAVAGWAFRSRDAGIILLAVGTWIYIAIAWTFGLIVNRGSWSPSAQDISAFIDLSVRRCRASLAAVWFAGGMFLFQLAFVLGWVHHYSPAHLTPISKWLFFGSIPIDIVWVCTAVFFGFLLWYQRIKRAELRCLRDLQEQTPRSTFDDTETSTFGGAE